MKRRLIYLSSLTLTVVINLTLASAHGRGGRGGGVGETRDEWRCTVDVKEEHGINVGGGRRGVVLGRKSKMCSIAGRTHSPLMRTWETLTLPTRLLIQEGPLVLSSLFLMPVSRWWLHNACWKMSSGHVREAIWVLIDGSRRTTAAMFSDITASRTRRTLRKISLTLLCLLPYCVSYCLFVLLILWKMDENLRLCDRLLSRLADLRLSSHLDGNIWHLQTPWSCEKQIYHK